jgi:pimeloyl-ACP methyl ester carboxylesterase
LTGQANLDTATDLLIDVAALAAGALALEYAWPSLAARGWTALGRAAGGLSRHSVRAGDDTIPYLDGGRGEPLVLVHGFGADKDNFARIAPFLKRHARVLAPDLPGFGEAGRDPRASYRIADQVERLHAFVEALALGPVHLGGSSMGGFIVAEFAARYPALVRSLWLIDAAGVAECAETPMLRQYLASGEIPLLVRDDAAFATLLGAVMQRPAFLPHSLYTTLARRAVADHELHVRIFREIAVESPTLEPRLAAITAPTLIVWGEEDQVLSPGAAAAFGRGIAGSEVVIMAGIGHLPMLERPRASARDYLRFRARVRRDAAPSATSSPA